MEENSKPKRVKLRRVFIAFVAVVTLGQVGVLYHYNALLEGQESSTAKLLQHMTGSSTITSAESKKAQQKLQELKQEYHGVTVSPNGRYATYLTTQTTGASNTVNVIDLDSGNEMSQATDLYPIQNLTWLGNEEIFVGEQRAPGSLELNTFYVSNGSQADQTAASVPQFSALSGDAKITKVTYSQQTNDVFVLIKTATSSVIYHIGTMEHIQTVPFQDGLVKNIGLSETDHRLYVEALNNGVWNVYSLEQSGTASPDAPEYAATTQLVAANAALISVIGDELYYGSVNSQGLVTAVYKKSGSGKVSLVKALPNPMLASDIAITSKGTAKLNPTATPECIVS